MVHVIASQKTKASPQVVWNLLANAEDWQRWSPMDETKLERRAPSGNPNGVGALRRFRTGRITSREEVVVFDAPRHFAYVLVSGMPLLDYRADVTLEAAAGGSTITWKSQFRPKLWGTGWIYAFMLRRFLARFLQALANEAEKAVSVGMESVPGQAVA